ncbi:dynein axonemal assembly factor 5 [Haematobia irritans]|uniref:dynein axonemal assembly factor 5 n=1 Tax=Haematobia irritans TaxID=7368 RepID=UPI003F4FF064
MFVLDEICEKLLSSDRRLKISSLKELQNKCLDKSCDGEEVVQIYDACYLHLLKGYSDRFESVRDKSVETVNTFIECLPPNDFYLSNILSALVERLGQQETVEESEEIRLVLMQQLAKLIDRFLKTGNKDSLLHCKSDIVLILAKGLKDPYPAVQREACNCVSMLASANNAYALQTHAEPLAKGLYGMLNHKHSQSRIAAVKALSFLALHIDASGDLLSTLLMEVSPLLMDSMPLVRRECGELGIRLLLDLRDRYSYFERLIPFVLCCLKDDSPEVRDYILPLWIKCGRQYYEENEAELNKQDIADTIPSNYPQNVQRPTIGCRAIVQRSLRLLKLIIRESSDWKENVRLHSLKLLYQFVLHAEASMSAKFFEIYPDVARSCQYNDNDVMQEAFKVADLMGRLISYEDWFIHAFEGLEKNAKAGYLKCFYYMYAAATNGKLEDDIKLMELLVKPEFSQTLNSDFQMYILKTIETVLDKTKFLEKHDENLDHLHKNCYVATIKVMALSLESEQTNGDELNSKGEHILQRIIERFSFSIDDLHEKYFSEAIQYVENIDAPLDALSEPILLFYGLIKLVKFREPYIQKMQEKISIVLHECADESKIKIFTAVAFAMLEWTATIRRPSDRSIELLKGFIETIVEPNLIWKAGANAEVMRSLATLTLCSMSQGAAEEARHILPGLAKHFPSLLEDNLVTTRHYAIKCLNNFGPIHLEDLKGIAYGCLQRLDDPSSNIRILAVSAIPKFEINKMSPDEEEGIWLTFVNHCMDLLFLHYDGPDKRLQEVIKDTILIMTKRYPEICKDSYERTMNKTHNSFNLKALKEELPF